VLPDHLHAIWNLPPGDCDFSTRWRLIKNRFARALPRRERLSAVRVARNERGIWQRRFWEHLIRDEADYARHVEYSYINPLKHWLVTRVRDWPYSSFHRDVRAGLFPGD
jgi:putative transposase